MKTIVNILLACILAMVVIGTASAGTIQLWANEVEIAGDTKTVAPDENGNITFTAVVGGWDVGTKYMWAISSTDGTTNFVEFGITNDKPYIISKTIHVNVGSTYMFTVASDYCEVTGKTIAGTVQATPEPTTMAMTAIGLLAVLGFVFRRKEE